MNRRFEITDEEWARLASLLPAMTPRRGGRWRDHRQVLNGSLFRVRTGVPWRDLPGRYGPWEAVYKRFARWQTDGTWARIEAVWALRRMRLGSWIGASRSTRPWSVLTSTLPAPIKGGLPRSRQAGRRRWGGHGAG